MNKKVLFFTVAALAALCSCSVEEDQPSKVNIDPSITRNSVISVKYDNETDVKSTAADDGTFAWSASDNIAVYTNSGAFVKYTLTSGDGTNSAEFSGTLADGQYLSTAVVYPYQDGAYSISGSTLTYNLPSDWTWSSSSVPMAMLGKISGDNVTEASCDIRHLTALFKVTYYGLSDFLGAAGKFVLEADKQISGDFTVDLSADEPVMETTTSASGKVTVSFDTPADVMTFAVPLPKGEYGTIKCYIEDASGNKVASTGKKWKLNKTLARKEMLLAPAINATGMTIYWDFCKDADNASIPAFYSNVPAIDKNGNVYVMTKGEYLYKLNSAGELQWSKQIGFCGATGSTYRQDTSPSLEPDGSVVYCLGSDGTNAVGHGRLWAINTSDGTTKWTLDASSMISGNGTDALAFMQTQVAVGDDCVYFGYVGSDGTLMSVNKETGAPVAYVSRNASGYTDGTGAWIGPNGNVRSWIVMSGLGENGSVAFTNNRGIWMVSQALLESPTNSATALGLPNVPFSAYYGVTWNFVAWYFMPAVVKSSSGKTYFATAQEESTSGIYRTRIFAGDAANGTGTSCTYPANDNEFKENNMAHHYWPSHGATLQDQGGLVFGEEKEAIIVYKKSTSGTGAREAGVYAFNIRIDEDLSGGDNWGSDLYSFTMPADVDASPAIDNNGYIHATTRFGDYYILDPSASAKTCTQVFHVDVLNLMKYLGTDDGYGISNNWSSIMIGADGRIYVAYTDSAERGHLLCLGYSATTGPSTVSSWPMRGGNTYHTGLLNDTRMN